jgi:hypothetical protein
MSKYRAEELKYRAEEYFPPEAAPCHGFSTSLSSVHTKNPSEDNAVASNNEQSWRGSGSEAIQMDRRRMLSIKGQLSQILVVKKKCTKQ